MAEALIKTKLTFLKQYSKLLVAFLSFIGVVSGCKSVMADSAAYGIQGLNIHGYFFSKADSSVVNCIDVRLLSVDSLTEYSFCSAEDNGYYARMDRDHYPWPDSVRLIASDPDSLNHGWFAEKDTLLDISELEEEYDYLSIDLDLYLEPILVGDGQCQKQ